MSSSGNYNSEDLDEIYAHWRNRFDWPGKFAQSLGISISGFLGSNGLDLGLYTEDEDPDFDMYA
ncbi:hypothetical protein [Kineosporia succinea]|uniref:Uncharacterized protein n=1 Tax=Kineosporia succinea TaxID=84632 RepID=A0ABT9PA95_9ACTN|nr:hypothetical protein [Kineosporia succinea]MDP9829412.1 hypothetical protein [Kineosporia succinea]